MSSDWDWDWGLGFGNGIGDWDWGLGMVTGDWGEKVTRWTVTLTT